MSLQVVVLSAAVRTGGVVAMIRDRKIAEQLVAGAFEASQRLDSSIETVQTTATSEDLRGYKLAVGAIMAELHDRILAPIFTEHPDLTPDSWREWFDPRRGKSDA